MCPSVPHGGVLGLWCGDSTESEVSQTMDYISKDIVFEIEFGRATDVED